MCLVSVIIPVYNARPYIKECIESILCQSFVDIEVILVDDGSNDGSGEICDEYLQKDSRVIVIHQKNCGVSVARNKGLTVSKGKYILFVDSDDWVDKDYIQVLLKNMTNGGLSVCNIAMVGKNSPQSKNKTCILSKEEAQISVFSSIGMQGYPVNKMFDRALILKHRIFFDEDIKICEDELFVINYIKNTNNNIVWNDSAPYHYRRVSTGALKSSYIATSNFDKKKLTEHIALGRCREHLLSSSSVRTAWELRYTKTAVRTLRIMVANSYVDKDLYNTMQSYVRTNVIRYVCSPGSINAKVSVMLSAISPVLELWIYKIFN